ncbi:MAG: hypothetical protein L6R39_004751 [Caloplaca ligustica]|nr:MAG: hypothetical protein L6R39_004751 [Caloplaca ligustica]
MSSNSTIAALEQKYIELLQKKIASLETPIISSELTSGSRLEKKVSNSSMTAVNGDAGEVASAQAQAAETVSRKESTVRSPIRFRQRKYNTQGFTEETEVSSAAITKPEANAKKTDHAMTFLQCFDESQKYSYSVITIEDDDLKALLFYALSHHPFFSHWENMAIASLFEPFIHNWSRLNAFVDKDTSHSSVAGFYTELESVSSTENRLAPLKDLGALNKALGNLKELLQLVQDTPGLKTYFSGERRMNEDAEAVSFHYLWTIFPPGEIVISRPYMGRLQAFIVKESTDYIRSHRRNDDKFWDLECWSYDWNGTEFNRIPVKFSFEDYKGFRSISSLSCYPMRYHRGVSDEGDDIGKVETPEALRELLIKRGKRYRKLCLHKEGNQLFEYDGFALSTGAGVGEQPKTTANQVIFFLQ